MFEDTWAYKFNGSSGIEVDSILRSTADELNNAEFEMFLRRINKILES